MDRSDAIHFFVGFSQVIQNFKTPSQLKLHVALHGLTLTRRFLQAKHPARDLRCVRRGAEGIIGSCCCEIFAITNDIL